MAGPRAGSRGMTPYCRNRPRRRAYPGQPDPARPRETPGEEGQAPESIRPIARRRLESEAFDVSPFAAAPPGSLFPFPAGGTPTGGGNRRRVRSAGLARGALEEALAVRPAAKGVCREVRPVSVAPGGCRRHRRQIAGGLGQAARGHPEGLPRATRPLAAAGPAARGEEAETG